MTSEIFKSENNTKFIDFVSNSKLSNFPWCSTNNYNEVKEFINNGADVNSSVSLYSSVNPGFTPLHFAVLSAHKKVIELLLKNGADCNRSNEIGETSLHLACKDYPVCEKEKIIQLLLDYKACPTVVNKAGYTPVHLAFHRQFKHCLCDEKNILDMLMAKTQVNFTDCEGVSFFHIACTRNDISQINNFLDSHVKIDSCATHGWFKGYTALHFAVAFNRKEVVEILLKKNAQVNIKTNELDTPLHLACECSWLKYYDLNFKYKLGKSNEKPTNSDWMTVRTNQLDIIKLLLLHGADINAKDGNGFPPLLRACTVSHYYDQFNSYWQDSFMDIWTNEFNCGLKEIIKILLSYNADINDCSDIKQLSILHMLSEEKVPKISDKLIEYLITTGADVHAVNFVGLTPLHWTIMNNRKEMVQTLLNHNVNVNEKCRDSNIPLQKAIDEYYEWEETSFEKKQDISKDLCIILLENGSDINVRDVRGVPLLHEAVECRSIFVIEKLLYYGADINMDNPSRYFNFECNDGKNIKVAEILFIHINKLLALGLYVSEDVLIFSNSLNRFLKNCHSVIRVIQSLEYNYITSSSNIFDDCTQELNKMKHEKIDSYTSLYDILVKNPHELSKHVKNSTLTSVLKFQNIDEQFPLYSYLLKLQFKKGSIRSDALKSAIESLIYVIGYLPYSCCDSILKYLTNEEIANLNEAAYK